MKRKELTKIFIMISNWKKKLVSIVFKKTIQCFKRNTEVKRNTTHLQQCVTDQSEQKPFSVALSGETGMLRLVHSSEIKDGRIFLAMMIRGEVQREFISRQKTGHIISTFQQLVAAHVLWF